jgi:hypothetical protein
LISLEAKTIWQGKVGIRDRYVKEAVKKREGLLIRHGQDKMVIPFKKLKESIVGKSDRRFQDQIGREKPHYLIYFTWVPTVKQGVLC